MTIYFEELTPGRVFELGTVEMTEDEILEFAARFDPQPFHLDREAAAASHFGGLIASGWHTCSCCMRLMVDGMMRHTVSLGSPGVDEIRWSAPVRPGDRLTGRMIVEEATPSSSNPTRGSVRFRSEMENQDGVIVLTMRAVAMFGRRPTADPSQ
ncbi:MAG: MaoC family dehydratase [Acidimicrobiia bacterium]